MLAVLFVQLRFSDDIAAARDGFFEVPLRGSSIPERTAATRGRAGLSNGGCAWLPRLSREARRMRAQQV
jgi:hypothetical protein